MPVIINDPNNPQTVVVTSPNHKVNITVRGSDGKSAYEVAVENGFIGDEAAWLASLVGEPGPTGETGPAGAPGTTTWAGITDRTGFDADVAATPAVAANTAKVSNANHTGDVTGSTVLTIADDAVSNAKLANMAANTVKVRAASSTGDPSDLALAASQLLGRGASGDIAAIALHSSLEMEGNMLKSVAPAAEVSSYTRGKFIDVRDYGITPDNVTNHSAAIQAIIDTLAADDDGGTIYFPACPVNYYYLIDNPVFLNSSRIKIVGDGMGQTVIYGRNGPAFVVGKDPKNWACSVNSYIDTDTGLPVDTKDGSGKFILTDGRYRVDRRHFTGEAGAIYGAGPSGVPVLEVVDTAGTFFGFRSRGVCKAHFPANPLATGCISKTISGMVGWEDHRAFLIDFVYYAHDAKVTGGIAGCGSRLYPDPWLMVGDGTNFELEFAVTEASLIERATFRIIFAQPAALGLHRVSVQINADTGEIGCWVDRVQVSYTLNQSRGRSGVTPFVDDFGGFNYFARWRHADFTIGSMRETLGELTESLTVSDFTIVGFAVYTDLHYNVSTVGSAQTRIDAATITDGNSAIQSYPDTYVRQQALGCLAIETATGHNVHTWNTQGWDAKSWGMIVPKGSATTVTYLSIEDLSIRTTELIAANTAILLYAHLSTTLTNVAVPTGFYSSVSTSQYVICYPLIIRGCDFYSPGAALHLVDQWAQVSDTTFGYCGRCTIRTAGTRLTLDGATVNTIGSSGEGFLVAHAGRSIAGGYNLKNLLVNFESNDDSPRVGFIYIEKSVNFSQNWLVMESVTFDNAPVVPNVILYDTQPSPDQHWTTDVRIDQSQLHTGMGVVVCGKDWRGYVRMMEANCVDQVVEVASKTFYTTQTYGNATNLRTLHKDMCSTPAHGGWVSGCHDLYPPRIPDGGVVRWGVETSGVEGSASPPVWVPIEMAGSSTVHPLSGVIMSTFYASLSIDHPDLTDNVGIWGGFTNNERVYALFAYMFHGTSPYSRASFQVAISKSATGLDMGLGTPVSRSSVVTNNATMWPAASAGTKTNGVAITMTAENEIVRQTIRSRAAFFLMHGPDAGSMSTAWQGRTEFVPPNFTDNCGFTIAIGGLTLANSVRPGSWCHYMQNKIMDWFYGAPSTTFPGTFYYGLSSTTIAADGTGITEPSGGSYARVSSTLNSTNYEPYDNRNRTWANKTAITFPTPTADWGLCTYGFISDASSGGNILAKWPLNRHVRVYNGDPAPAYAPGAVHFQW